MATMRVVQVSRPDGRVSGDSVRQAPRKVTAMRHEFFARRLWSACLILTGAGFLLVASFQVTGADSWWRILGSVVLVLAGLWNAYAASLAIRKPMVAIADDGIEARAMFNRATSRISRDEVLGVAWSNPGAVGLQLRSGEMATVNLIGLSPTAKAAVCEHHGRAGAV